MHRVTAFEEALEEYKAKQDKAKELQKNSPFKPKADLNKKVAAKKELPKIFSWLPGQKKAPAKHGNITYRFYVLNLDRRPERFRMFYENMQPKLMKGNTCRIGSVDGGADISSEFAEGGRLVGRSNWPPTQTGGWAGLNPGALGCFMSHTLAWDAIEKDDVDVGIVLEDDAYMWSDTFDEDMKRVILDPENVNNKDVILMGHCEGGIGGNVGLARGGTACTTGMAVMKHAIPKMREKMFPVYESIDSQLNLRLGYDYDNFELWRTQGKMLDQRHDMTDIQQYNGWGFKVKKEDSLKAAKTAIPDCE